MPISTEQIVVTFLEKGRRLSETAVALGLSQTKVYEALLPIGLLPEGTTPPAKKTKSSAHLASAHVELAPSASAHSALGNRESERADGKAKGRKCELTEEQIVQAIRYAKTLKGAAKELGFSKPTVRRRMKTFGLTVQSIIKNRG